MIAVAVCAVLAWVLANARELPPGPPPAPPAERIRRFITA